MEKMHILATSSVEASIMTDNVKSMGGEVGDVTVWTGIEPPNSFMFYAPGVRMSTPEYFLFRKMARANDVDARTYACEMFGKVGTKLTVMELNDGEYEEYDEPRLSYGEFLLYLKPVAGDADAKRVRRLVLDMAETSLVDDYGRFVRGCYTLAK